MNLEFKSEERKTDQVQTPSNQMRQSLHIEMYPSSPRRGILNPPRQTKVVLFYTSYIVAICVLIVGFLYSLFHISPDKLKVASVFSSVSRTMNDAPISEIFITEDQCLEDYEVVTLGKWPGTIHGCFYPHEQKIERGQCAEHTTDGIGVNAMPARPLFKWRGQRFCVKRYQDYDISVKEPCKTGYRKYAGYLCIPVQQKGPITSIKIYKEAATTDDEEFAEGGNRYVSIQRRDGDEPIVNFHLTVDGYPCLDLASIPYRPHSYPLLNIPPVGCGYGENSEAKLIDSKSLMSVLKESPVYRDAESLPLYYESIQNNTAYFTAVPRFKVKKEPECLSTSRFDEMGDVSQDMLNVGSIINLFFILCLFGTFSICFFALEARAAYRNQDLTDIGLKGKEGKILFGACVVLFLFCFGCFAFSYGKIQHVFQFSDRVSKFTAQDCFLNKNISIALNDFAEALPFEVTVYSGLMIIMIILSFLPIVVMLSEKFTERRGDGENRILLQSAS